MKITTLRIQLTTNYLISYTSSCSLQLVDLTVEQKKLDQFLTQKLETKLGYKNYSRRMRKIFVNFVTAPLLTGVVIMEKYPI